MRADKEARARYEKEYHARPEVRSVANKLARARYHDGGKERKAEYDRSYRNRPDVREKKHNIWTQRRIAKWSFCRVAELRCRAKKLGVPFALTKED